MNGGLAHAQPLRDAQIYISLWVLLLVATLARVQVDQSALGGAFSVFFWGALFGLGLAGGRQHGRQAHTLFKRLSDATAVVGLLAFLVSLGGGVTQALLSLLSWMQLAKCFTLVQRRDLFFTVAISFVMLLFAAAQSKSEWFLLFIALYTLAAVYTLLLAHADNRRGHATCHQEKAGGRHPFPASSLLLTATILASAGALYLFVPRPPAAHLGAYPDDGGTDYRDKTWQAEAERPATGGTDEGDGAAAEVAELPPTEARRGGDAKAYGGLSPVFDITAPGQGRGGNGNGIVLYLQAPQGLYLRGRVFDRFDGRRWSQSAPGERKYTLQNGYIDFAGGAEDTSIHQIIEVAGHLGDVLVAAPDVVRLGFPGPVLSRDREGNLRAPRSLSIGTRYEVQSRQGAVSGHPAMAAQAPAGKRYLQLPEGFDPEIAALARRVTARAGTPLDAALALENHLRGTYAYSFESIFASQGDTPLGEFLFESRRGHCEYFASAMTIMLRAIGIPARLATGFSATTYNPVTGYYEVWALDGHAWTEAYIPEHGWVSFEPTPFYHLPKPTPPTLTAALDAYLQRLVEIDRITGKDAQSSNRAEQVRATALQAWRWLRDGSLHLLRLLLGWLEDHAALLAGLVAVLVLASIAAYRLRHVLMDQFARWRIRRGPGRNAAAYVALCYQEAESWLRRRGQPRHAADTLEEYTAKVSSARPPLANPLGKLARRHGEIRYGGHPADASALAHARAAFEAIAQLTLSPQLPGSGMRVRPHSFRLSINRFRSWLASRSRSNLNR